MVFEENERGRSFTAKRIVSGEANVGWLLDPPFFLFRSSDQILECVDF